jgi:hypothetical protein
MILCQKCHGVLWSEALGDEERIEPAMVTMRQKCHGHRLDFDTRDTK